MNRYILSETIKRFQEILADDISPEERKYAAEQVASMQRELALLDASLLGVQSYPNQIGSVSAACKRSFGRLLDGSNEALLIIDPRPGLHIVDMTPAFETATMADRGRAMGGNLFEVFPDSPDVAEAEGVSDILNCLRMAAFSGLEQVTEVQRYDVRNADGPFVERYWRPVYVPVFDEAGVLAWLLVRLEDITRHVSSRVAHPRAAVTRI